MSVNDDLALAALCRAMSVCPVHRKYVLADINTMLIPPIRYKQYRFFRGESQFGAITWAFLNERTAAKHVENKVPLAFEEWQSGSQFWIISLIGHGIKPRMLLPKLAARFPYERVNYIRRDHQMKVTKIVSLERRNGKLITSQQRLT